MPFPFTVATTKRHGERNGRQLTESRQKGQPDRTDGRAVGDGRLSLWSGDAQRQVDNPNAELGGVVPLSETKPTPKHKR